MHDLYKIDGTSNKDDEQLKGIEYNNPNFYPNFQNDITWFKSTLIDKHQKNETFIIMRVYDGEFHFLNKNTQILHETRVFYMYTSPSSCAAPNGYLRLQAQKIWYCFYVIVKGNTYKRFKIQNVHEGHKLLL